MAEKVGIISSKKTIRYQISKYIDNKLVIEQQIIKIRPDAWTIVRQMLIDQGWHVTISQVT